MLHRAKRADREHLLLGERRRCGSDESGNA
jgi:hypothetical protein